MIHSGVLRALVRALLLFVPLCAFGSSGAVPQNDSSYRNAKLDVDLRGADLLSRMTLDEKVAQLQGAWQNREFKQTPEAWFVDEKRAFAPERAAVTLKYEPGAS